MPEARDDLAVGVLGLTMPARARRRADAGSDAVGTDSIELRAIPYFAWANRRVEAMRVWIPMSAATDEEDAISR